jgi:RimJ/RimL family protein N-acetyltransferase
LRHNIVIEGYAFRLRPVTLDDARFILDLRTDPTRNSYIHATPNDTGLQRAWIERYFDREGDYYFVIEALGTNKPEGTIGVYDIDSARQCGEWGRWIVGAQSAAGLESALLIHEAAFTNLGLEMVYARTAVVNTKVITFHDSLGLERHAVLPGFLNLQENQVDAIEHRISKEGWLKIKPGLESKVARMSQILGGKR